MQKKIRIIESTRQDLQVKWFAGFLLTAVLLLLMTGCKSENRQEQKGTPVEFSVMNMREIPQELAAIIEENKQEEIRMTFAEGDVLYLVRGYGEQKTGGYSICVKDCYEDEETIWLDTQLLGPKDREKLKQEASYPCLVIRMKRSSKAVMIQ